MKRLAIIILLLCSAISYSVDVDLGRLRDITWTLYNGEYVANFAQPVSPYPWDTAYNSSLLFWEMSVTNNPTPDSSIIKTNVGLLGASTAQPTWRSSSNNVSASYYFDGGDYIWKNSGLGDFTTKTSGTVIVWARVSTAATQTNTLVSAMRWASGNNSAISFNFSDASPYPLQAQVIVDATTQWAWGLNGYYLRPQEGWRFFAVKHDGTQPYIFRNSKDITSLGTFTTSTDKKKWFKAILTDASSKADNIAVGSSLNNGTAKYNLNGWADSVKIYGRALTDAEISECFYRTCTNYGYPVWVYEHRDWYSNASLIVSADYPAESTVIPAQSIGFVSNNVWRYWGWGGTLVNGAYWALKDGKGAYYFDGENDYGDFGVVPFIRGVSNCTMAAWVYIWKTPDIGDNIMAYARRDPNIGLGRYGWEFGNPPSSYFFVTVANGSNKYIQYNSPFATGIWYHVCSVFDGTKSGDTNKVKLYINGQLYNNINTIGSPIPSQLSDVGDEMFRLGTIADSSSAFVPVYLSDVFIWAGNGSKYSLSSNEVYQLYLYGR